MILRSLISSKSTTQPHVARRAAGFFVRTTLALAVMALWAPLISVPQAKAGHSAAEKLYVGQQGKDNIVVFNADTISDASTPITTISLGAGAEPQELVADDERPYLYASDSAFKVVHVVNTITDSLEYSIPLAAKPHGLALSKDGSALFVATDTTIVKIDTRSRTSTATSATLSPSFVPMDVALSQNEDRLWVTGGLPTGEVRAFSPSTLTQTSSITPGGAASGFGIVGDAGNSERALYADNAAAKVRTASTSGNTALASTFEDGPWAIERQPHSPNRYLVTDRPSTVLSSGDTIVEIDATSPFAEKRRLTDLGKSVADDKPSEIAFSNKLDRAFVTLAATDKVSVINLNPAGAMSESAVVSLTTGAMPYGIEIASSPKSLLRFAGENRYDTGVQVSQEAYADKSVDALVVASLEVFPDSLVGSSLSGLLHGPLLGTRQDALPDETKKEIARIFDDVDDAETDVWVVGGTAVVSDAVISTIKAINPKLDVGRLAGANRYETSKLVAQKMDQLRGTSATAAFVAKGTDFPDALTAGAIASNTTFNPFLMPILLTESDTLNSHTDAYLKSVAPLGTIFVAGGTAAISSQITTSLAAYAASVTRLGGVNRFDTARIIASYFFPAGSAAATFARGDTFPDALVAASFAGISSLSGTTPTQSMPILLVNSNSVPSETSGYISSVGTLTRGYIAGGTAAISSTVESTLNGMY